MMYLLVTLNLFVFVCLIFLYKQFNRNKQKQPFEMAKNALQERLDHQKEIVKWKIMEINQQKEEIGTARDPVDMAYAEQRMTLQQNEELDLELQKIPTEALEKYLTKIHIINVLPYKYEKRNVIEVELLQHSISTKTGYYDAIRSVVKLQFTDKEDCIGINEILAVEKNEEGKTMVYFTLGTSDTSSILIPQVAYISSIDEA